jgi:hypothetical protein
MSSKAIYFLFGTVVFVAIACVAPFARKRVRARWAKAVFVVIGLTGATDYGLTLAREMRWFTLGFPKMDFLLLCLDALVIGMFLALTLTGQLFGKKRTEDEPPA